MMVWLNSITKRAIWIQDVGGVWEVWVGMDARFWMTTDPTLLSGEGDSVLVHGYDCVDHDDDPPNLSQGGLKSMIRTKFINIYDAIPTGLDYN